MPVGRSVDETLRLLHAFQYTDSHGEVCPANWKPGADTVSGKNFSSNDRKKNLFLKKFNFFSDYSSSC